MKNRSRKVCLYLRNIIFLFILLNASYLSASEIQIIWVPPDHDADGTPLTDLAGYRIYAGTSSGTYDMIYGLNVGKVTQHTLTVTDLQLGVYYIALTAYDLNGNESTFSDEIRIKCRTVNDITDCAEDLSSFEVVIGGKGYDSVSSVQQTRDGGYIAAGSTYSYGAGGQDAYLAKLGEDGSHVWERTFGGTNNESGNSVRETSDGGYIIAGNTNSYGAGGTDVYLVKTDAGGVLQWGRTFGGKNDESGNSVQETSDGGYIIAGYTNSYGAGGNDVYLVKTNADGVQQWERTFGGVNYDQAYSVLETLDGGYVIAGRTGSYGAGGNDAYLIKTDADGMLQWERTYGGVNHDQAHAVFQTLDGGYVIAGKTGSYGAGGNDAYLVKTDADGVRQWGRYFGGKNDESGNSVKETADGGYIIAGYTSSYGAGGNDVYLVKTDADGALLWERTYGGVNHDQAYSMFQTLDGGYILGGNTSSYGAGGSDAYLIKTDKDGICGCRIGDDDSDGDGVPDCTDGCPADSNKNEPGICGCGVGDDDSDGDGVPDCSDGCPADSNKNEPGICGCGVGDDDSDGDGVPDCSDGCPADSNKNEPGICGCGAGDDDLDKDGIIDCLEDFPSFAVVIGGKGYDSVSSVKQTWEGGYIAAGSTYSYGAGGQDAYLIKLGQDGSLTWEKTFGGRNNESWNSVQETSDGGYIIAGYTGSYGAGGTDVYLVKTDADGVRQWERTFGRRNNESGNSVRETSDGGYIIAGYTGSYGAGGTDVYLVKTDAYGVRQWERTYGGVNNDQAYAVLETSDGGYIIAGYTGSYGAGGNDVYLVKTNADGVLQWERTYGGVNHDQAHAVFETLDGGYVIAGKTGSYEAGGTDVYLVKTNADGLRQWERAFGGKNDEAGNSVQETSDGGYIIAGYTGSYGAGGNDVYLVKTNAHGVRQWERTYGGVNNDQVYSVFQTLDGGYILGGHTGSYGAGSSDVYLLKTDAYGNF